MEGIGKLMIYIIIPDKKYKLIPEKKSHPKFHDALCRRYAEQKHI